jgi:hypothetical protein
MQLRHARLCLDCEEVHTEPHCPVCASEAFTYVSRWVPAAERFANRLDRSGAARRRPPEPATNSFRVSRLITGGAVGFAVLAAARWLLRAPESDLESATGGSSDRDGPVD